MTSLSDILTKSLGREAVEPSERLMEYSIDGIHPEAAVFPAKVEDVSQVLSLASREKKAVTPRGGGTQMALGNTPSRVGIVLGISRLNRVLLHEPADLVTSTEAGITLKALQDELTKEGQFLPLESPLPDSTTIGGMLAANSSGPSRLAYGTARDWLIGIKVVQPDGVITKSGGRVVKNVAGYDLHRLYTGSLGTLGLIVEASFKIAPLPSEKRTLIATYSSLSDATDSAYGLLRRSFIPQAFLVINREVMDRLPGLGNHPDGSASVLALFTGRKSAVKRKTDDSVRKMERGGASAVESISSEEGGDTLWQAVTDLGYEEKSAPPLVAKVSILPSQVKEYMAMASRWASLALCQGIVADVGTGLVRHLWWAEEGSLDASEGLESLVNVMRQEARPYTRHVVLERCPNELKSKIDVWGDSPEGVDIMRRLKQQLDPAGILNPGRFAGRI